MGCGDVGSARLAWQTSYIEDEHSCSNTSHKAGLRDVSSDRRNQLNLGTDRYFASLASQRAFLDQFVQDEKTSDRYLCLPLIQTERRGAFVQLQRHTGTKHDKPTILSSWSATDHGLRMPMLEYN